VLHAEPRRNLGAGREETPRPITKSPGHGLRRKGIVMRKAVLSILSAGLLVGPFASSALADHDPVREAFCRLADELGYDWVQDCNLH
jgi:hypothetical protein